MHFAPYPGSRSLRIGLAGLGSIGIQVARLLDAGIPGLELAAVAAADQERARERLAALVHPPPVGDLASLAACDVVVEMLPSRLLADVARPTLERGATLVVASAGALLSNMALIDLARASGGRILVPSGAIPGLDAIKAVCEGQVVSIRIDTRKSPDSLAGAPHIVAHGIDLHAMTAPAVIFSGTADEAAIAFPANTNVAAALALAGVGPERTTVCVIADPAVDRNIHTITVDADSARFIATIEIVPNAENPRSGQLTPRSIVSCLRDLVSPVRIGS
ncbi:aspartate dehydrogenase [Gluconacetobacter sacchari]|uniref:L-aspartate dehydrogenase n=2 Tax=Gluconacetobacter sacchari TaxID=92759 RepID=A0A7W4I958_9PROT|nr:aspartate dehydrogenase [Gluconacetobacter sacchari]MBB2158582.1 aspartate dehydrogenase [Gluconacetobacter sacchari]GBQ26587.1 L-aspartate dehydrogenase [Gluconacetobacter sacchari DSM 12717]